MLIKYRNTEMTAQEILNKVLEYTGETKNSLAKRIGLPRSQNLYDIESGKTKNISSELSEKIVIEYPEINRQFLLTGIGEMLNNPANSLEEEETPYYVKRRERKNIKQQTLTYYDVGAAAGIQADILPVKKNQGVLYINDLFRGSQFAIRISGNSMIPSYPPGAIIGIREVEDKRITPGAIYVIERKNELWIKRLFYKDDNQETGMFECMSDNTMKYDNGPREGKLYYPPFYLGFDEVTRLFKVTGIYKSNELTVIQ